MNYGPESNDVTEAEKKEITALNTRLEKLKAERSNWETHWQEVYDYIVPRKGDITSTQTPGTKRGNTLFDTTAINANQLLSSALHGMLTNPSTKFFDLVMGDPVLDEDEDVKRWLQEVGDRMFNVITNSNFQTEIHEIYIDLGAIGTACMFMGEHEKSVVHFNARSMKEVYIEENNLGLIDIVWRVFKWKPRQIIQEFGEKNVPEFVCKAADQNCDEDWEVIHLVEPLSAKNAYNHKFKSCYYLSEKKAYLSKSGFREMPYAVPRWTKTTGEKYGRGPGMEMLPDIKMINKMKETTLKGAEKTVDPPMMVTDDGVIGKVRLTPAGLTVVRAGNGDAPIRPLITDARIDFGYQAIADIQKSIKSGFFLPQVQLGDAGPQKTATETNAIVEEQLRFMGPILGRQHFELLRPMIDRLFDLMEKRDQIPPAPEKVQGKKVDVVYSSLIARAQRMNDGMNIGRALSVAAPFFQMDSKVVQNVNGDEALKYIWDIHGLPKKLLRKAREVQKMREDMAKAQEQAAQQQQEQHQADMASKTLPGMAQMAQAGKGEQAQ
jgi:hypothetical protein